MHIPTDVLDIIFRFATDMMLLEMTPLPSIPSGCLTPLNFEVLAGVDTTIADLLVIHIVDAVCESNPKTITNLFINSKIAEIIDFPLNIIKDFEYACTLWQKRCALYNITSMLPPSWQYSLPYLIVEFMAGYDVDTLHRKLDIWMGTTSEIRVSPAYPFLMLFN